MSAPWGTPPPPDRFSLKDYIGRPVFIVIGGFHPTLKTTNGDSSAIRCTVVSLVGIDAGQVYEDVLIFNTRVVGRFKASPQGFIALTRVTASGQAVDTEDPQGYDENAARMWWEANPGVMPQLVERAVGNFALANSKVTANNPTGWQPTAAAPAAATGYQPPAPPAPNGGNGNYGQPAQPAAQPPAQPWTGAPAGQVPPPPTEPPPTTYAQTPPPVTVAANPDVPPF